MEKALDSINVTVGLSSTRRFSISVHELEIIPLQLHQNQKDSTLSQVAHGP